jgi:hypothetical protein
VHTQRVQEVALVPDQGAIEGSRWPACTWRSMIEFIQSIRAPLVTASSPASFRTAPDASVNVASRSRIRDGAWALASSKSVTRFRPGRVAHAVVGVR